MRNKGTISKKRRMNPLELAAKNASFDILGYIRKKYKEALLKRVSNSTKTPYFVTSEIAKRCIATQKSGKKCK